MAILQENSRSNMKYKNLESYGHSETKDIIMNFIPNAQE